MKKLFLIITLSSSFTPVFSQKGNNSHGVIDLNKRAVELNIRNLSNNNSIYRTTITYVSNLGNKIEKETYFDKNGNVIAEIINK